jgi:hypothetical protein
MARPGSKKSGRNGNATKSDEDLSPTRKTSKPTKSWTRLQTPEKSPADNGEYRLIRLDNGLRALLISRVDNGGPTDPAWVSVYPESRKLYHILVNC